MAQGRGGLAGRARRGSLAASLIVAAVAALATAGAVAAPSETRTSPHGAPGQKSLCLDCHDPHRSVFARLLRFPPGDEACWTCHDQPRGVPFHRRSYEASPHFRAFGAGFRLTATTTNTADAPAWPSSSAAGTCIRCHEPHGRVAGPKLLRTSLEGYGSSAGAVNAACAACHPAEVFPPAGGRSLQSLSVYRQVSHADPRRGAVWPEATAAPGQCTACHDPHGTPHPALLRAPRAAVCYPCHPKPAGGSVSRWTGEKAFRRSAHAGVCLDCHNPHGASDPRTGAAYPKALVEAEAELCFRCHAGLGRQFAESREASASSGVRSRHPADQPGSMVSCLSCHNPHLVRTKVPGGAEPILTDPDTGKLFAWLSGASSREFCLKCHDGSWPGAADVASEAAKPQAVVTGFVWAGKGVNLHYVHLARYHKQKCSACHDPHATVGPDGINRGRLLSGLTVTAFQGGYPGYEACATDCHHVRCAACHPAPPDWNRGP